MLADTNEEMSGIKKKVNKTGHYLCGGGGGGEIMGWARPIFFREKGWAKREFHDDWGWVIVCFVKNHTHYNSCGKSK